MDAFSGTAPHEDVVAVTNNGPDSADSVVVTDTLPAGLVYVSNDCGAAFANPVLTWNVGTLANAGGAVCQITTTVAPGAAAGPIVNSAQVTSATTDPTPGNATSFTTFSVSALADVPALGRLGLLVLLLALGTAALTLLRRS
jgi:hypothetical protein